MARYKEREPATFEAIRIEMPFDLANLGEGESAMLAVKSYGPDGRVFDGIAIRTRTDGQVVAREGQWVVRGLSGKVFVMDDDTFQSTYEAVD